MAKSIPSGFSISSGVSRTPVGFSNSRAKSIIDDLQDKQRERLQIDEIDRMSLRVVITDLRKRADEDDDARRLLNTAIDLMEPDLPL
jgi:hypothetical protein